MHKELGQYLKGFSKIFFEPMWGNNGDRLIKEGSLSLFRDLGISLVKKPIMADAIVINGGGAMTSDWGGLDVLNSYIKKYDKKIIVLPSSFMSNENAVLLLSNSLDDYSGQVSFFCREKESFERLRTTFGGRFQIFLSHDMALYLTGEYLKKKYITKDGPESGALIVERRDAERSTEVCPHKSWDIPMKSFVPRWVKRPIKRALVTRVEAKTEFVNSCKTILRINHPKLSYSVVKYIDVSDNSICSFKDFLSLVDGSKVVFTTRLHVAILCDLFKKKCYLRPTGGLYKKNEQVFYQSLSNSRYVELLETK